MCIRTTILKSAFALAIAAMHPTLGRAAASDSITTSDTIIDAGTLCAADSACPVDYPSVDDPTHRVHPAEWIVPGCVAVAGAVFTNTSWGKNCREDLQGWLTASPKTKADNYLQYVPALSVYALNLCGVKGQHNLKDRTVILAMSYVMTNGVVAATKKIFRERRPDDSSERTSFPSGHTAVAFMGAEYLWQEYRSTRPWIGYTGYAVALGVGYLRILNNRHWTNDVLAGAAIGMLSTKFAYWLYSKMFSESTGSNKRTAFIGMPYYEGHSAGVNLALVF